MNKSNIKVLVTGGTGFVSSWTIKYLLEEGYAVRTTVRSTKPGKADFLKQFQGAAERLELVVADLGSSDGWSDAVKDCTYVHHIASPYSLHVKNAQRDLVDPAVNGTLFVLRACKDCPDVKRVILTSSVAAVSDCFDEWATHVYDEKDWNTTSTLSRNPYYFSKTLAEKAAHDYVEKEKPGFTLAVINPFIVLGPSLDPAAPVNQSVETVIAILKGDYPVNMPLALGIVDVRDVAQAHIRAMDGEEAAGRRFLLWSETLSMHEVAKILTEIAGNRKINTKPAPKFLPRGLIVLFARLTQGKDTASYLKHNWGKAPKFDVSPAKNILKLQFRTAKESIQDTGKWAIESKRC